ncbi:glycosyltransferase [Paenibacillus alkalitolerans]|uniref:glycosyltransferase n=1 Tax=Paenibacillus alkalitolerans TaxID=2799335 RepID=UPI0018F66F0B|nr:glycosyltransferase [Paenibacillus alkalitolerans]
MANSVPFYLIKRVEGEGENDRFGDRIACGDINGDGAAEWVISASSAARIEGSGGVNPQVHYYVGKIHVLSADFRPLYTINGEKTGERFGASLVLGDVNGDGIPEIIVGSPRAGNERFVQCGMISIYSGVNGELLHRWYGKEDFARLGSELAVLDWNRDGRPDIAASSHMKDPQGVDLNGNVSIYSIHDFSLIGEFSGTEKEAFGASLCAADLNGDGYDELIVGAPKASVGGLNRNGKVYVFSASEGLVHESQGKRSYDEYGLHVSSGDLDGDGVQDLLIGSPMASDEFYFSGSITAFSLKKNEILLERYGWFGRQGLGHRLQVAAGLPDGSPKIFAGSRCGTAYYFDAGGKEISQFSGFDPEAFGYSLAVRQDENMMRIAIGAVSGLNQTKYMSGAVYFISTAPPADDKTSTSKMIQYEPEAEDPVKVFRTAPGAAERLKILFATYWYLPHVGGVDLYVRMLKNQLEKAGHHVDVLAHHPDMVHYYLVNGGKKVEKWQIKRIIYDKMMRFYQRHMPHVDPWVRYRDIERYSFEAAALLFDLDQYDIIHTQDIISTRAISRVKPQTNALVATIHGLLAKEYLIYGSVESKESTAWKYVSAEEYYGCVSADATIVPTDWLRREMAEFEVPASQLAVIPYGMNIPEFERESAKPLSDVPEKKSAITISCPARMVPVKGHRTLLGALSRIADDQTWHCWLIGDGLLMEEIKQWIEEYRLTDRVTLLGYRDDVPGLLKQSDIMVLPSLQDNLPFSIMEAQLAGVPIVASNAGGIPEMIQHEQTGLLFEKGNEEQLADRLITLARDPGLRGQLTKNAREWALRQWSESVMVERTMNVYERALRKVREKR